MGTWLFFLSTFPTLRRVSSPPRVLIENPRLFAWTEASPVAPARRRGRAAMAAQNAGIIIDCRQAMSPDPPAVELEVIGSSSPSITPCPAAAAPADADFDHDGCTTELSSSTDRELQDHIRQWEGSYGQGVLRRMPDGGEKMHSRVLRMKKELERRRARQRMVRKMWTSRNSFGFALVFLPFCFGLGWYQAHRQLSWWLVWIMGLPQRFPKCWVVV